MMNSSVREAMTGRIDVKNSMPKFIGNQRCSARSSGGFAEINSNLSAWSTVVLLQDRLRHLDYAAAEACVERPASLDESAACRARTCHIRFPVLQSSLLGQEVGVTSATWTVTPAIHESGRRCRGLLVGRYGTEQDARQAFLKLGDLAPQSVANGLCWSETVEALISREAWNALTCEHAVRGSEIFEVARIDLEEAG